MTRAHLGSRKALPVRYAIAVGLGVLLAAGACVTASGQSPVDPGSALHGGMPEPGIAPGVDALVVAVREAPPFAMRDRTGRWTGISVDLWEMIAAERSWTFVWRELPLHDTVEALTAGEVDIAIAAFTLTEERERSIDYSHAYYSTGLATAWRTERSGAWTEMLGSLAWRELLQVTTLLVVVLFAAATALLLFERPANREQFGGPFLHGLGAAFWWSAVTMTTVGYGDKTPRSLGGRIVAIVWMFTSLVIVASFTGTIAATVAVHRIDGNAARNRPLGELQVGVVRDSSGHEFVIAQGSAPHTFADLHTAFAALGQGSIDVIVHDAPILRHEAKHARDARFEVAPKVLMRDDYGFGLRPGFPLREDLNVSLLSVLHAPTWLDLRRRYLGE
jgi:ABC-type amino acid transport substrate-binding protein